ncbi:MAG: restriction endonuclease subunit S [Pseudomonas balearica]|uniref:restriction endonuclease subunit S n=1 Tax=Stutzerimonas balearica TaxID=74829 RepID=UPI0019C6E0B1|nr:restriction endonuclease subunit S [Stutzerimonas balearica]MBC7199252.1 restriction endonuclease subunit S [Stutzerimonas balearica]
MRWPTKSVESSVERLIDYRGKTPTKTSSGVRLITAKVIKGGRILPTPAEYIAIDQYDSWMRRGLPKKLDVLLTTEAPLGEIGILRTSEKVALAQRVILLRGKPGILDQRFMFYAMQDAFVQDQLHSRSTGTTVLGIKQSELRKVELPVPDLLTQGRIASTLSAYDDLIENNTRRIEILEEMARRLYEELFVQFRFPGHEDVEFKESELGLIPEGWVVSCLGDIAEEIREAVHPSSVSPDTPYIGLEHLPRRSITLREWGSADSVSSGKLFFRRGDVLFGKIRPYFHKVVIAPFSGICSSDTILIRPKKDNFLGVVLCCSSSDKFVDYATQTSNGTKMPRADWKVLKNYPVLIPSDGILSDFNSFVLGVVGQARNLMLKNVNLRAQRDLLLPKLISGEIDVSDIPMPT